MQTFAVRLRVRLLRRAIPVCSLGGIVALALTLGCAGPRDPRHGPPEPPQSTLAAHAEYCAGSVLAEATVTSFRRGMPSPAEHVPAEGGEQRAPSGPPPGGAGGSPRGGGFGGPPPGGHSAGGFGSGSHRTPGGAGFAAMPRQTLMIRFTNRSATPVTLTITALDSLIGNFAPRPEKLTIAPGATESLDPVSGDAGGLLNWLDLTLSLRHEGTTETHTLHLVPTGEPGEHAPPNRQR